MPLRGLRRKRQAHQTPNVYNDGAGRPEHTARTAGHFITTSMPMEEPDDKNDTRTATSPSALAASHSAYTHAATTEARGHRDNVG